MKFKVSTRKARKQLKKLDQSPFAMVMAHGLMSVEYFEPRGQDKQAPHRQDEIYVIANGKAVFSRGGETVNCRTGDVIFVPAGMEHRFEKFSKRFATWVIFYGDDGGEKT